MVPCASKWINSSSHRSLKGIVAYSSSASLCYRMSITEQLKQRPPTVNKQCKESIVERGCPLVTVLLLYCRELCLRRLMLLLSSLWSLTLEAFLIGVHCKRRYINV